MNARNQILAPLLVMVLMTLLVGGTAYQQIATWEDGIKKVANHISEMVILNNIQAGLRQVKHELTTNPEQAQLTWQELQQESRMLATLGRASSDEPHPVIKASMLYTALEQPKPTSKQVKLLLKNDFLALNLDIVKQLKVLGKDAERVTWLITCSMLALGVLLTLITARDLERLFRKLARSRDLNTHIQEEERRRLAQELHDGAIQELIDLKRQFCTNNPSPHNHSAEQIEQVIHTLRRICHNLKPQVLEDLGLPAALHFLADDLRQAGIAEVHFNLDEAELAHLPKTYELPIFRVIQELCSNLKRHAHASRVNMAISYNPDESPMISGYVSDNGQGFDPKQIPPGHMGLTGLQERIQQMQGQFQISSQPGHGAQFQWVIPVKPVRDDADKTA
jgi:signal transduction histidine kinase